MVKHSAIIIACFVALPVFANTAIQSRTATIERVVDIDRVNQVKGYEKGGYCGVNKGPWARAKPRSTWYSCDSSRPPVTCMDNGREGMICSVDGEVGDFSTIRRQADEQNATE